MATFTSNTSHRAVFSNVGFSRGVHEFRVTILRRPCCGYVGLCASTKLGTQDSFFDSKSCFGINNFSGSGRDVGREAGTSFCIRVDMNRAVITYITKNGERSVNFEKTQGLTLHAALDSDENGQYTIERVGKVSEG